MWFAKTKGSSSLLLVAKKQGDYKALKLKRTKQRLIEDMLGDTNQGLLKYLYALNKISSDKNTSLSRFILSNEKSMLVCTV